MLAVCNAVSAGIIPEAERYLGETEQTEYASLKADEYYLIFALFFISDRVDFLVCPSEQSPLWVPSHLFELVDNKIPPAWQLCFTQSAKGFDQLFEACGIRTILGYPAIIQDYDHYVGVIEGDDKELQVFYKEKEKIEYWWDKLKL